MNSNGEVIDVEAQIEVLHPAMVKKLKKDGELILKLLTPGDVDLWHGATGLGGEALECLDAVKKLVIYRKPIDRTNVVEELGDCEFYMEQIRQNVGITRHETLVFNFHKLNERYPGHNYSDALAQERRDKLALVDKQAEELPAPASTVLVPQDAAAPQAIQTTDQLPKNWRRIETHGTDAANKQINLFATDEAGAGGASHQYFAEGKGVAQMLHFQKGAIQESGLNGITNEVLLAIVMDRMEAWQNGPYANDFNRRALGHLQAAMNEMKARSAERAARGVEGTMTV